MIENFPINCPTSTGSRYPSPPTSYLCPSPREPYFWEGGGGVSMSTGSLCAKCSLSVFWSSVIKPNKRNCWNKFYANKNKVLAGRGRHKKINKPSESNGDTTQLRGMASTLRMRTAISPRQWEQQEPLIKEMFAWENFPPPPPPFKNITVRP